MQFSRVPYLISFAGNPIRYGVYRLGPSGKGTSAQVKISFTATDPLPGNQLSLSMLRRQITFTLDTVETPSTLPVATGEDTPQTWAMACFEFMQRKFDLISNYDLSIDGADIILSAHQTGEDFNISVLQQNISGMNITTLTEGTPPSSQGVLNGFLLQVRDSLGKLLGEEYKPADASNAAVFDVSEYLNSPLEILTEHSLSPSVAGNNHFQQEVNHVLKYRVSVAPVVDQIVQSFIQDIFRWAVAGGLSREARVDNLGVDYFSLNEVKVGFLTNAPQVKTTDKHCPERLYWMLQNQTTRLRMKIRYYTPAGYGDLEAFVLNNRPAYSKYELLVGYDELALGELSAEITSWKVWIEDDQGEALSREQLFELDTAFVESPRYFVFRNSFGHYDFVRFSGKFEQKLEHERDRVELLREEDDTMFNAPAFTTSVRERVRFKANSGWVSEESLEFLRDFLLSREIYERVGDRYFRVVITSQKTDFREDRLHNHSLAFEYERGYEDVFFTTNNQTEQQMIPIEESNHGVGAILQASDDVTYFGYPKSGTLSEDEPTWRIKRVTRTVLNGMEKHLFEWADGNSRYDNVFSNCQSLNYSFLTE